MWCVMGGLAAHHAPHTFLSGFVGGKTIDFVKGLKKCHMVFTKSQKWGLDVGFISAWNEAPCFLSPLVTVGLPGQVQGN